MSCFLLTRLRREIGMSIATMVILTTLLVTSLFVVSGQAAEINFDRHVAPIFVSYCIECHSGDEPEGELSLVSAGLDELVTSRMWERVRDDEMPPKHPLADSDKNILKQWIDDGAVWGTSPIDPFAFTTSTRAGRDWWSLQPLRETRPPMSVGDSRNPIDAFVTERLAETGLTASPQADPRTLIRRLYFDLVGLPPSPATIDAFTADPSDIVYEQVVDDLLASKHYGERWARHWLDVVRFGESDGFERNFPRESAWPYRDWVINAFNADMPYDEFVRMQLIGDIIVGGIDGAAATGFWVSGVHNTVVGGSKRMKDLARQDELEDVLAIVGQSLLGMTVNCARCHNHKFDPITQKEYYTLASAISGLGFGERNERSESDSARLIDFESTLATLRSTLADLNHQARSRVLVARSSGHAEWSEPPQPFARWEFEGDLSDSIGHLHATATDGAQVKHGALVLDGKGFASTPVITKNVQAKTLEVLVQLDSLDQTGGGAISIEQVGGDAFDAIVFGERDPKHWMSGSSSFARYEPFGGTPETEAVDRAVHLVVVYSEDGNITAYRDGVIYGKTVRKSPIQSYAAGETEILFGLRHQPPGGNRFLSGKIHQAAFFDRALSASEVETLASGATNFVSESDMNEALSPVERDRRAKLQAEVAETAKLRDEHVASSTRKVYTLSAVQGATTNVLLRGDPENVGDLVTPAAIASVSGLPSDFELNADAPESLRRRKLAEWITSRENPLFTRVMVNRLWHHHFGAGIVDTPNDLGFNGGRPTHPELLEFLAWQFRENGYHLKPLHRLMVTSNVYRQASFALPPAQEASNEAIDVENRLLWRGNSRRLDAESLRDAMLSMSGKLGVDTGGPGFKDVSIVSNSGTTYYEPIDVDGEAFWRRTVYRFSPRGGRSSLLDTFDCPDPASSAPNRAVTTTPLQALSLLNNAFVLRMAEHFAARLMTQCGDELNDQITQAWRIAIGREPTPAERELSQKLVEKHGLSSLCRGLFNFNEFVTAQ